MTQEQKRIFLINYLLGESGLNTEIPVDEPTQKSMLRALFDVRMPKKASKEFLRIQDEYLQEEWRRKGVTDFSELTPVVPDIYLWQGDITTLKCDAIVNAANSQMLGCFCPNHSCIDNAIHTFAGVQLRQECALLMKAQGCEELIRLMVEKQKNMKIPSELLPFCPVCGKPMTMNLRADDKFVQDSGWYAACERYENFIENHANKRTLYLELVVGGNTPVIIKYPFWRFTDQNPKAIYACINYGEAICPSQIENRSICINEDIGTVLREI